MKSPFVGMEFRPVYLAVILAAVASGSPLWAQSPDPGAGAQSSPTPISSESTPPPTPQPDPPVLSVDSNVIQPESVIEVTFHQAVAKAGELNQPAESGFVEVTPALPGRLIWKSERVARYELSEPPLPGVEYTFSLGKSPAVEQRAGLSGVVIGKAKSVPFKVERLEMAGYYNDPLEDRAPMAVCCFTEEVSPDKIRPFVFFINSEHRVIRAKVWQANVRETQRIYNAPKSLSQRFAERPGNGKEAPSGRPNFDKLVSNSVMICPEEPLPEGHNWEIVIYPGVVSQRGGGTMEGIFRKHIGSVVPVAVEHVNSSSSPGESRRIDVRYNQQLDCEKEAVAKIKDLIEITPPVPNFKPVVNWRNLVIEGDFAINTNYKLRIKPGVRGKSGTVSEIGLDWNALFKPCDPYLALPNYDNAQLANGRRQYGVESLNMKSVRVRIKALTGTELVRALQAYDSYTGTKRQGSDLHSEGAIPFEIVSGTLVHDQVYSFEKTRIDAINKIPLDWTKMVGATKPAALFISAEAHSRNDLGRGHEENRIAQSLVQVTDLGVAWKQDMDGVQLYVFSCQTGEPVGGADVHLFREDAKEDQKISTDRHGGARLPLQPGSIGTIKIRKGDDQFCFIFDNNLPQIRTYRFPISSTYEIPTKFKNVVSMFTDRYLYRPGETIHLKGILRERRDKELRISKNREATLSIRDNDDRTVSEKKITLTDLGTFAETFDLPASSVGKFRAILDLPVPEKPAAASDSSDEEEDEEISNTQRYSFSEEFTVQEFRRNTFEVHLKAPKAPRPAQDTEVALAANYLMGKPLSDGKISWSVHTHPVGFYPERYSGYYFGDHAQYDRFYWYRYFGFRDNDGDEEEAGDGKTGEVALDPSNPTSIRFPLPKYDFPSHISVNFRAEVTDANQQTLAESLAFQVPSSEFYIGMNRIDSLVRAGSKVPLSLIVVDNNGQPWQKPVAATVTVEHEAWNTSVTQTQNGDTATRSDSTRKEVFRQEVTLKGDSPVSIKYVPEKPGSHYVMIRAKDSTGAEVATRVKLNVWGDGDYAWEYEDGARIRLVPDKKEYQPGETAKILVQTPVDGTALIAVERSKVLRSFVTKLSSASPVIEVPVTDADAPNVYVSVTLIKGAKENRREYKEPISKLGYCCVKVANRADQLAVRLTPAKEVVRPGVQTSVQGVVVNSKNSAMANAEVTLWAVDEGVLQVAGYSNPDFLKSLLPQIPLGVKTGTTLPLFLPERLDIRSYENKGFTAGGGGFSDAGKLRIDFNPCPLWIATLRTDSKGAFRADFKVPDSLTRFRVLAVAVAGARQFGSGLSAITVNKPLMVQPVVPRVAHIGDRLQVKALVHNTSKTGGEFEITLNTSAGCPIAGGTGSGQSALSQRVHLNAKESRTLTFDVAFETGDEARWTWKATTVKTDQSLPEDEKAELVDYVESKFPVYYPLPIFREAAFVRLNGNEVPVDLMGRLTPELVKGSGEAIIEISPSILTEAGEAIEHVLHYPYGCVEQTTSSMAPWFAARDLREYVPAMRKSDAEIKDAIQRGANRLLSMQTNSGALAYWPGGSEPCEWGSAYGGMGLLLARENGATVPDDAIDRLTAYLSDLLRRAPDYKGNAEVRARILYVLALAGKPEPAYLANMSKDAANFNAATRALLAMALVKGNGSKDEARKLLELPPAAQPMESDLYFLWRPIDTPMELMAWCMIDPGANRVPELVNRLVSSRTREGHWGATINNAWSLNALAAYARTVEKNRDNTVCELQGMGLAEKIVFGPKTKSKQFRVPLTPSANMPRLMASVQKDAFAFCRIQLISRPKVAPAREVSNGYSITRTFEAVNPKGGTEPLKELHPGDVVLVTLSLHLPKYSHYISVEDPLPAILEAVNPEFASQTTKNAEQLLKHDWCFNHVEYRDDRVAFFADSSRGGRFTLKYLARVTGQGSVMAPPARIESMYNPEEYGLSATDRFDNGAAAAKPAGSK